MGPSRTIRDRLLLGIREKLARSIVFHEWPTTLKRRDKTKAQGARCSTCSAAMAKEQDRSSTAKTNRRSCVRFRNFRHRYILRPFAEKSMPEARSEERRVGKEC